MVRVRLEVRTGTARFRVSVRTSSVQRALGLTGARLLSGETVSIPALNPDSSGRLAVVGSPPAERMAA